jgi:putative hydrolase of the HAD superfamily
MIIRGLLFDLGGTLLEAEPRRTRECEQMALTSAGLVAGFGGEALDRFVEVVGSHLARRWEEASRDDLRSPSDEEIVAEALARLGEGTGRARAARICQVLRWNALCHFRPAPGATETLALLRRRGCRLAVVSNLLLRAEGMRAHLSQLGLSQFFETLVFSSEVGWLKPHPRVFQHALEALGARAEETVFIGDDLRADIQGAQAAGLHAIWKRPGPPLTSNTASSSSEVRAEAVIDRLSELPQALERMGGR